ncbi:E3 ubiquitin-protein ligase ATL4-like [Wolffia australiana]
MNSRDYSLLIITAIVVLVCLISFSIHFLLRRLSRERAAPPSPPLADDRTALIESLPLFTRKSSAGAVDLPPECAVCLSNFNPEDQLRLLPFCCHAFHASCIDAWLRSSLSCPLCRTSVVDEPLPPLPPRSDGQESVRIEITGGSRRIVPLEEDCPEVKSAGGDDGGSRRWVRGYVDRVVSSASTSFSSLRFSARSSRRHEGDVAGGGGSWDFDDATISVMYNSFYRWLVGP